jgi:hypothetical protein
MARRLATHGSVDIAGIKIDVLPTAVQSEDYGVTNDGREFIDINYHKARAIIPQLDDQARLSYDELSAWLRQVTEKVGIPRQSEFFLVSWLIACNLLYILQVELMKSNRSPEDKQSGVYWLSEALRRMELTGLWHLQFAEDGDATAGVMGDGGKGEQESEI